MTNKIMTYHTDVDRTIPDRDLAYDKLIGNTSINVNEIVSEYKMIDEYYNEYNYIIHLLNNKINRPKIRMLFLSLIHI